MVEPIHKEPKEPGADLRVTAKLFHWQQGTYNYFIMSQDVETARTKLLEHLQCSGAAEARALGHVRLIAGPPLFVAEPDYPIVVWLPRGENVNG